MSRIGKKPVPVGKAKATVSGQKVNVEGPKGNFTVEGVELANTFWKIWFAARNWQRILPPTLLS